MFARVLRGLGSKLFGVKVVWGGRFAFARLAKGTLNSGFLASNSHGEKGPRSRAFGEG